MKVLIVGAGVVGLSAAWALTRDGYEVTVLDQGAIPNPSSASFDQHRMIRPHYGRQTGYTKMLPDALAAWDQLWADLGTSHYSETGVLAVNYGNDDWMEATLDAFNVSDTPYDLVDFREIAVRAPMLRAETTTWGLFAPNAGVLFADRIVTSLAHWLQQNGAELVSHREVRSVDVHNATVAMSTGEQLKADRLIIAAGAWVSDLVPALSGIITPVRSVVSYIKPPATAQSEWESSPALFLLTKTEQLYALPSVCGTEVKLGGASVLKTADPNEPLSIYQDDLLTTLAAFEPYLTMGHQYEILSGAGGYYADPRDKRFILQQHDKALIITGCGGRMFKFGALFGLRAAEWVRNANTANHLALWAAGVTGR